MKKRLRSFLSARDSGITEWIILLVWLLLVCLVRAFHEPWFDETQAWQIARYATLKEIFLEVEHYEGHPPLWHLLLYPFAKTGFPYSITIFTLNTLINLAALYLLLFRSPMPRWLRGTLPFGYYIFYQHGVQTRPYCITMLALFLAAMFYKERDRKPGRFVLSLILLCLSTVFGVAMAFGICLVWLAEILLPYLRRQNKTSILRDKRCWWLVVIAAVAVLILLCTLPAPDDYNGMFSMKLWQRFYNLYFIPLMIFDGSFGLTMMMDQKIRINSMTAIGIAAGALMWAILIPLLKKNRKTAITVVPYVILCVLFAFTYFSVHHLEVVNLFLIFAVWVLFDDEIEIPEIYRKIRSKIDSQFTIRLMQCVAVTAILCPLIYTAAASVLEIRLRYGPQEKADFIRDNHLENRKILVTWGIEYDEKMESERTAADVVFDEVLPYTTYPTVKKNYPFLMGDPVTIPGYFEEELTCFPYFNVTAKQQHWMLWREQTDEETDEIFAKWQEIGLPDVVIGAVPLQEAFTEEQLDGVTYYWVDDVRYGRIWKFFYVEGIDHVYIRSDLLDEYPQFQIKTYIEEAKK